MREDKGTICTRSGCDDVNIGLEEEKKNIVITASLSCGRFVSPGPTKMHTLTHTRWNQIGALSSLRPANQSLAGFTQCRVDDELILSDLGVGGAGET